MTKRKGSATSTTALVLAVVALGVAVGALLIKRESTATGQAEIAAIYQRMSGIDNNAVSNALDPRYTDADGDLVADAPKDAAKQLDPATLTFSYVAVEDPALFQEGFKDLIAALSAATGKPVEFVSYDSFEDELRAIRDGKLQIAGLNTGSVPIGVCTAGFVPVTQLADANGAAGYNLQIIAQANSPITKLTDLRGRELTLTEPSSNSGYKAPLVLLREAGLRPPTDYLLRYSQGHVQSIAGVKAKLFEAAAVAGDVLKREVAEGKISQSDYKVIYSSDQTFPTAAIGYCSQLKPELAEKIRKVLTTFDFKGTGLEKLFGPEGKAKFVPVDYKKDWAFVRRIDESIGFQYQLREAPAATQPTTQTAAATDVSIDDVRIQLRVVEAKAAELKQSARVDFVPVPDRDKPFGNVAILIPTK